MNRTNTHTKLSHPLAVRIVLAAALAIALLWGVAREVRAATPPPKFYFGWQIIQCPGNAVDPFLCKPFGSTTESSEFAQGLAVRYQGTCTMINPHVGETLIVCKPTVPRPAGVPTTQGGVEPGVTDVPAANKRTNPLYQARPKPST